jgi:hypothetical protein
MTTIREIVRVLTDIQRLLRFISHHAPLEMGLSLRAYYLPEEKSRAIPMAGSSANNYFASLTSPPPASFTVLLIY